MFSYSYTQLDKNNIWRYTLANIKQAKKRIRQSQSNRKHNVARRSALRTFIKKTVKAIEDKNVKLAKENFLKLQVIIDRYAIQGLIHKNKAARHKSRLNAKIKVLQLPTL